MSACRKVLPVLAIMLLSACGSGNAPQSEATPEPVTEPPPIPMPASYPAGIERVSFGVVQRETTAEGVETCRIPQALPDPPTFEHAPSEISYILELDPGKVVSISTELITPSGQGTIDGVNCIAFGTVAGQFGQTQLGNTFSRADKQPFRSGSYRLRIRVNGETAEVPLRVK